MELTIKNLKLPELEPVNFELKAAGLYGLVGRNGIGKSTLFSILSGEISAKTGEIYHEKLAFFPGVEYFDPALSGWDYIKMLEGANYEEAQRLAKFFGADSYLSKKIGHYSFGMQQLFATILSFSVPSELLVIDELFNGLDVFVKSKVFYELKKISQEKIVLYTSHNLKEIEQFCDQTFILTEKGINPVTDFKEAAREIGFGDIPIIGYF